MCELACVFVQRKDCFQFFQLTVRRGEEDEQLKDEDLKLLRLTFVFKPKPEPLLVLGFMFSISGTHQTRASVCSLEEDRRCSSEYLWFCLHQVPQQHPGSLELCVECSSSGSPPSISQTQKVFFTFKHTTSVSFYFGGTAQQEVKIKAQGSDEQMGLTLMTEVSEQNQNQTVSWD